MRNTGNRMQVSLNPWVMMATMLPVLLGGGCATDIAPEEPAAARSATAQLLTPSLSLSGAQLSSGFDPTGMPSVHAGVAGFQPFIHPASVAGRVHDIYIADIGSGAVYRFDSTLAVMAALPGIRAQPGTQLYVGADLSLYLVDQPRRRVLHYARSGQLLGTFGDDLNLGRPVDIALDEVRGRVLVADGMYSQLVAFHPLGRASYVIPLRRGTGEGVSAIAAMAIGPEGIFLSDPLCACIALVSLDGAVLGTFGHQEINQPGSIAVDRYQRVFVIDGFDGSLKVFLHGELIYDLPAAEFGLQRINDVWVNEGWIILSDGIRAVVKVMRLAPVSGR